MADVNYENIPSIIGIYEGTVAQFEGITDKSNFYGRLILITGTDADKNQAMWTSEDDGTNAHYLNMPDVATLKAQLAHIDGIAFPKDGSSSTLYDKYDLTGGKGFIFKGSNGITVKINPSTPTSIDGKPYWSIEVNGQTLKADLIGTTSNGSVTSNHPDTIKGAKAYADSLYVDLKGTKAEDDTTAETIRGAKDYADKVKTDLEGTASDTKDSATIAGAKKYADAAVEKIVSDGNDEATDDTIKGAKKYTDEAKESLLGDANDDIEDNTILGVKNYAKQLATAGEVSIVESEGTGDIGKVYTFYQGGTAEVNKIGVINTPKELVVKSGQVVVNPTGQPAGTYIELTIQNQEDAPLYINVADLVDVYTAAQGAAEVQLSISATNEISATIKAVSGTKIINKTITKDKLGDTVQESLEKADTAYQKPTTGIPEDHLAAGVQEALAKANTAITSLDGSDYITVGRKAGGTIQQQVVTAKTAEITSEAATTDGLATVADIRAYLAARLSVKVVS